MVGRANAFFCAGGPTRLDPRRTKGDFILRRIHLLRGQIKAPAFDLRRDVFS
jgi:hypothetical protein